MSKKKLTISLLVSGRVDTTEKCLDSLRPLMEQMDCELILVDTGCDEAMKQLLVKYTSQIIPFEWCNDFAKARNVGLENATGEWFMFLDDDEWFEDVTPIVNFFQSHACDEYDQAVYKVRNYADFAGRSYSDEWLSRMIRVEEDTCFKGKVHEILGPARGKCAMLDAFVHHYGYVNVDSNVLRQKVKRNVPLLLEMIAEEPNNLRWRIQIVQEYISIQSYDEAIQTAQDAIDYVKKIDKRFVNQCRTVFETAILRALCAQGNYEKAMDAAKKYLVDERNTNQGNMAICHYGMQAAEEQKLTEDVLAFGEQGLAAYDRWKEENLDTQEAIIEQSLLFVKDVTKDINHIDMLRRYTACCVQTQQTQRISLKQRELLKRLMHQMMYQNADFLNLPQDIYGMAKEGLIDLEAEWLSLELSQWKAALQVLKQRGFVALEKARSVIEAYRSCEDIRYSYFYKEYVSVVMALESKTETYEKLVERFFNYMKGTLEYYLWIFQDKAFEGDMEMLPADAKAAAWLNQMFSRDADDWEGKLSDLREAAKSYPALGNNIKRLAKLIGEEVSLAKKQEDQEQGCVADDARVQLQQMLVVMKDKIRLMMQQGMREEAQAVLVQVRTLAPDDEELAAMEELLRS
ncbi:MAG: glycosyltransferase [Agathobacter sp.]|nr:glycosyltransferase [Agathobacter sp.]